MDEEEGSGESEGCVILSLRDTSCLLEPIASSKRIKYTCVAVSLEHVALGANTGGVYCFHKQDFSYIRILSNQEGGVSAVKFSPGGGNMAVVCGRGHVSLWELNLAGQGISKRVHTCTILRDGVVTDLVWDEQGSRVFFGDELGRVAVSYLPKKKFKKPDEIIFSDSPVVQMDIHQDLLLVSTAIRCIILHTVTHEVVQVGKKSRDGQFGACFNVRWPGKPPVVYSARPGSRLWEADIAGTVVSTLKQRELITVPPAPIFGPQEAKSVVVPPPVYTVPQLLFPQLLMLQQQYMVGWVPGSALFFLKCASYKLATWTCALGPEDRLHGDGSYVWVVSGGGRELKVLQLVPVSQAIHHLTQLQLLDQARVVMVMHHEEIGGCLATDHTPLVDHTLLLDCATALNVPDELLNQQLVDLKKAVVTVLKEQTENGEELVKVDKGVGGSGDCSGVEDGGSVVGRLEGRGYGAQKVGDLPDQGGVSPVAKEGEVQRSEDGVDGDDGVAPDWSGRMEEDGNFPKGPIFYTASSLSHQEPDLDSLEVMGDSVTNSNKPDSRLEQWTEEPQSSEACPSSVARSQSKNIPQTAPPPNSASLEPSPTGGSAGSSLADTPSSTTLENSFKAPWTEDSLGATIDSHRGVVKEGQEGVDKEALAMRVRQMSLLVASSQEDVIAVPSKGSGSSSTSSKAKSKKKSRRKKSAQGGHKQLPPGQMGAWPDTCSSNKVSPVASASLLHIPEEQDDDILPFPDVGLPPTSNSSPSISIPPSPYTSLPPTPPLVHSPPTNLAEAPPINLSEAPPPDRKLSREVGGREDKAKPRSASIDLAAIGGALSKGQRAVKGFFTSLSSQPGSSVQMESVDVTQIGTGSAQINTSSAQIATGSTQPLVYRNFDADLTPAFAFSPPSSAEEGELAENLSPLAKDHHSLPSDGGLFQPPSPQPEVTAFVHATLATREMLENPAVLCFRDRLRHELLNWIQSLEAFQAFVVKSDLVAATTLSPSTYACGRYLATMCADMGIYVSRTTDDLEVSSSNNSLQSFIRLYGDYLDRGRVLQLLSLEDWSTRMSCWDILVAGAMGVEQSLASSSDISVALLRYPMESEHTLASAASKFPWVQPWQVALACKVASSDATMWQDYVDYLCELLANATSDVALGMLSESFERDEELVLQSLKTVLHVEGTESAEGDECPRPWSHMLERRFAACLDWLVNMCLDMSPPTKQNAAQACREGGYWLGYVKLLVVMGDRSTALKTLLCLGDVKLLTEPQPWGFLLETLEDWQIVMNCLAPPISSHVRDSEGSGIGMDITPPTCISDLSSPATQTLEATPLLISDSMTATPPIPPMPATPEQCDASTPKEDLLSQLLPSLLWTLTSQTITFLLSDHSYFSQGGSWEDREKNLHSQILGVASIHTRQRAIAHSLLENVDRYLWTKRTNSLTPHLRLAFQTEKVRGHVDKDTSPLSPTLSPVVPVCLRLEDVNVNWGVRTSGRQWRCPMCGLGLTSVVSDRQPGLLTFLCGHAVHKNCCPEGVCVVCFKDRLPSSMFSPRVNFPSTQQLADLLFKPHP